ncbi:MAG TPA: hypothetical protein VFQ35_26055 [Polyangiaceae bacterium]|nr:hypothetical protein [Polyangiaceae bacterium]
MKALLFVSALLLLSTTMTATVSAQGAPPCEFAVSGDVKKLYSGALRERLELVGTDACKLALVQAGPVRLVNGSSELRATAHTHENGANVVVLETDEIPTNLVLGDHDWEIQSDVPHKTVLGKVRLEAAGPAATVAADSNGNPVLEVSYGRLDLDVSHSLESSDGQAVVTNLKGEEIGYIRNEVQIQRPAELASRARDIAQRRQQPALSRCQELWAEANCVWKNAAQQAITIEKCELAEWKCSPTANATRASLESCLASKLEERVSVCEKEIERGDNVLSDADGSRLEKWRDAVSPWRLIPSSWRADVWLYEPAWWYDTQARQSSLAGIRFAVMAPHTEPLLAHLELRDGDKLLLRTQLVLAKGARLESLPLPIASALDVRCAGKALSREALTSPLQKTPALDIIGYNETRAVDDADVEEGRCFVVYHSAKVLEPQLAARGSKKSRYSERTKRALLATYGQQELEITISRGGAAQKSTTRWLDPAQDDVIPVPALKEGSGVYSVSVRLRGPSTPIVQYRRGPRQTASSTAASADLGELEFRASLRPRGHLGWRRAQIRTFVTFPLRFTGMRFPAKASELRTSNDSTTVQVVPVKAGIMAALEPWNYDTDRNPLTPPMRVMTGFHLYDLSNGDFAPSFLLGGSLTFPILQTAATGGTGNLGTDVAIGAFWEVDLQERHPIKDGSHFLLTLGVDVLTLFAK